MPNEKAFTIYHNPRCGKSRAALGILTGHGIEPTIVEYLKTPLDRDQLRALLKKLGLKPEQIVRKGEDVYKRAYASKTMTDDEWLDALVERPIVVKGNRAVVGRPPEKVTELL
jgi:arsenate reductase (glutaredoxin)